MSIPVVRQTPANPHAAAENRRVFDDLGVICVHIMGGTGSGKTAVLERILPRLKTELRVGVIEGDLAATCDAQRVGACGVPVVQVLTDGHCHLDAAQVQRGMGELPLDELDLLLIEDVGSPICPARVDLGEHVRVAVLATSGGQVALKYPQMVRGAALILLNKYDLRRSVDFDEEGTVRHLRRLNPTAEIICTDARNRVGIDRAAGWLLGYVRAQRMRRARPGRLAREAAGLPVVATT